VRKRSFAEAGVTGERQDADVNDLYCERRRSCASCVGDEKVGEARGEEFVG